jgi:tRNA threonylcarbamoyladenosine biosynthesis protein TsaB
MLLLATDTSGKHGSIALARVASGEDARWSAGGTPALLSSCAAASGRSARGDVQVIEVVPLAGGTFSAQLVPQIAALLAKHGFTKHDIGGFVVASGPGSFTGLRVGMAAIKALAEILDKPIAPVSLLEAIAVSGGAQGFVTALLDAGRGEVYVGKYERSGHSVRVVAERLLSRAEVWAGEASNLVTADEVLATEARAAGLSISTIEAVNAGTIVELGWRKLLAGKSVSPEELEANYIRRSDAEIFAKSSS